mgnify:CR=1 FL=1
MCPVLIVFFAANCPLLPATCQLLIAFLPSELVYIKKGNQDPAIQTPAPS